MLIGRGIGWENSVSGGVYLRGTFLEMYAVAVAGSNAAGVTLVNLARIILLHR
jgi:hypothetical protein